MTTWIAGWNLPQTLPTCEVVAFDDWRDAVAYIRDEVDTVIDNLWIKYGDESEFGELADIMAEIDTAMYSRTDMTRQLIQREEPHADWWMAEDFRYWVEESEDWIEDEDALVV